MRLLILLLLIPFFGYSQTEGGTSEVGSCCDSISAEIAVVEASVDVLYDAWSHLCDSVALCPGYIPDVSIQRNSAAVTTGGTAITFTSALGASGTAYTLIIDCYNGDTKVGYQILSRTQNGFTIKPLQNSTCEYNAILK